MIALGFLKEDCAGFLRKDVLAGFVVEGEGVLLFPLVDLDEPFRKVGLFETALLNQLTHTTERVLNVASNRVMRVLVFIMLRTV